MCRKILLDTGVWISYFGDRPASEKNRVDLARQIINYCIIKKIKLFYCPYVENELIQGKNANRDENIIKMKKIATGLPAHIGNDTYDQIDNKWGDVDSLWNNDEEVKLANVLQEKLPDKKKKSNRIDRNIVITALNQNIDVILHENPRDYRKLYTEGINMMDLTSIKSLEDFIKKISSRE